jgi:hypothetical protein
MQFYLDDVLLSHENYRVLLFDTELRTPPARGENVVVFNKSGRIWRRKKYDEARFVLAMYVVGETTDAFGNIVRDEEILIRRLDELKKLFSQEKPHELRIVSGSVQRRIGVEVRDAIAFRTAGEAFCRFAVEFVAPYPFWLGTRRTYNVVLDRNVYHLTVVNEGTHRAENANISVYGETEGVSFAIGPYTMSYNYTIPRGNVLTISIRHYDARLGDTDVSALITHSGDALWLPIPYGINTLTITCNPADPPFTPSAEIVFDEHFL